MNSFNGNIDNRMRQVESGPARDVLSLIKRFGLDVYGHGEHDAGKKVHKTDWYKFAASSDPTVELLWSMCPHCSKVINKRIIGYGNSVAYVMWLTRNGEEVYE